MPDDLLVQHRDGLLCDLWLLVLEPNRLHRTQMRSHAQAAVEAAPDNLGYPRSHRGLDQLLHSRHPQEPRAGLLRRLLLQQFRRKDLHEAHDLPRQVYRTRS
jgi:hypothetical protein